jgi:hypothetical protein
MQANASAYPYYNPSTPKNLVGFSEAYTNTAWVKTNSVLGGNGVELVANGEFSSGTSWSTPISGASITGGQLAFDGATSMTGGDIITSNTPIAAIVVGKAYLVTYTIVTGTTLAVSANVGGTATSAKSAAGTYSEIIIASTATAPSIVARVSTGARTGAIDNFSVQEVATYTSPNNSSNAYEVLATSANGTLTQSLSLLASPYTFSIWLRRKTGTGTVEITVDGTTYVTAAVTADWQRFSTTLTPTAGTRTPGIRIVTSGDAVYAWGAQLSDSASLDPYVPNFGAAPSPAAAYGPRLDYDPSTLAAKGLLVEEQRTNVVLHNSDLTNAAWTATNVTTAKTQTGPDGTANSATLLTATAGNGTVLQAITLASSARFQSAYVKRVTGTGTIEMTMDNGSTWTAVTVTSSWTRVSIPSATITNPTVGFRIVTSGDEIAVFGVQNETGAFATSVISTAAATVTRNADVASVGVSQFPYSATEGSIVANVTPLNVAAARRAVQIDDGTENERYTLSTNSTPNGLFTVIDGGSSQAAIATGTPAANTNIKLAARYKVDDFALSVNGGAASTDTTGTLPTANLLMRLGSGTSSTEPLNGHIRQITYIPRALTNAELIARST